jgi:uncharacterized membrane protein
LKSLTALVILPPIGEGGAKTAPGIGSNAVEVLQDHGMWLRWVHFLAGVIWIGLLWFFNWINGPFTNSLGVIYAYGVLAKQDPEGTMHWITETQRGNWITMGFVYGTIMAFNVWFVIWPRQKKIIGAIQRGEKPDPSWPKVATNASRINTYLSLPLLFSMGAGKHMGELGTDLPTNFFVAAAIVTVIGFAVAWLFIHKVGPTAGKDFKGA